MFFSLSSIGVSIPAVEPVEDASRLPGTCTLPVVSASSFSVAVSSRNATTNPGPDENGEHALTAGSKKVIKIRKIYGEDRKPQIRKIDVLGRNSAVRADRTAPGRAKKPPRREPGRQVWRTIAREGGDVGRRLYRDRAARRGENRLGEALPDRVPAADRRGRYNLPHGRRLGKLIASNLGPITCL
jgi:hypothetical protein